jgi:hypothetical protein
VDTPYRSIEHPEPPTIDIEPLVVLAELINVPLAGTIVCVPPVLITAILTGTPGSGAVKV